MRAALVVAHPDDETLWGAGWILTHPDEQFDVLCCSVPRMDPKRGQQFHDACGVLGVKGYMLTGKDHPSRALELGPLEEMMRDYKYVVTHNYLGEYGHPHHIQVHHYVAERFRGRVVNFGRGLPRPDYLARLTPQQAEKKLQALQCYSNVSPTDRQPKWKALLERYFHNDLARLGEETYAQFR